MAPIRRLEDEPPARREPAPEPSVPEPAVLALQRSAGNAAVARLLAREPAPLTLMPPRAAPSLPDLRDPRVMEGVLADWTAAGEKVEAYFDSIAKEHRETLVIPGSMAALVHGAGQQELVLKDGTTGKVVDKMKPPEIELRLRERARAKGMEITEHATVGDLPGMKTEVDAILANLGAIPTQVKLGNDDISVTASISGKVSAEAKAGPVKIEGEGSSEGIEGGVTVGPVKGSFSQKSVKAEVKVGSLLKISGALEPKSDGAVGWSANIELGTIGKLIMPEDVAKVFKGAQDTFSKSAGELARNLDDPSKVSEHGGALVGAIKDASEKASKSAEQAKKTGWRLGVDVKGDGSGGVSGGVTLTWTW